VPDSSCTVVLGAAAGTAAAGMYLDAKLGLGRDLREISRNNETAKLYAKAGKPGVSDTLQTIV
jgi:hypothetical protein